jgi:hypothetical protein
MSTEGPSTASEVRLLLGLLDSQLHLLERWSQKGAEFVRTLEAVEQSSPEAMPWDESLDTFLKERDRLLDAVQLFDRKITETVPRIPLQERTPSLSHAISMRLTRARSLLEATASQDSAIFENLSLRAQSLARNAALAQRSRQILSKFKSQPRTESGEEVDSQL